jgi:hypothetical protein
VIHHVGTDPQPLPRLLDNNVTIREINGIGETAVGLPSHLHCNGPALLVRV